MLKKPNKTSSLGIEKLITSLDNMSETKKRLSRDTMNALFADACNEIAYASQIIPVTLTDNLISDAPQSQTNLELNEIALSLIKTLLDPRQKDALASLIQAYRYERKKTEKEYASELSEEILSEANIKSYPEKTQFVLKELAQTIIEKIINEKQLRTVPGYRIQALIEIIEYFIYQRSPNIEIERFKVTKPFEFRKFINSVCHTSYEKATDIKKLALIQKEKTFAFNSFKKALASKTPLPTELKKLEETFRFLQTDQYAHYALLKKQLNTIFNVEKAKKSKKELFNQLHIRFHDKLRKVIKLLEADPENYLNHEIIKKIHADALSETEGDIHSLQHLITIFDAIQENYSKNFFQSFAHKKNLETIDTSLTNLLLGKNIIKTDPITAYTESTRVGGYPQKNCVEIYSAAIKFLTEQQQNITGIFADALKLEIKNALTALTTASKNLRVISHAPSIKRTIEAKLTLEEESEALLKQLVEAELKQALPKSEPTTPSSPPEPEVSAKIETKPLLIDEIFDDESTEPLVLEKVEPKPLAVNETFDDEPSTPAINESNFEDNSQTASNVGLQIMKNYQLGEFESAVSASWQQMMANGNTNSDNEVRLYVICDLIQQVSSIKEENLDDEQKLALQKIKTQIIEALKDPLDEQHWDYFEGTQRAYIDGTLSILGI